MELFIGIVLGFAAGWFFTKKSHGNSPEFTGDEDDEVMAHAREAVSSRTEKRFDRIMSTAEEAGRITNDGVEDLFCISDRTASTYLRKLTEAGRLQRHGVSRGTYYTPVK
jgi:predicted HTH transcriptional regulator